MFENEANNFPYFFYLAKNQNICTHSAEVEQKLTEYSNWLWCTQIQDKMSAFRWKYRVIIAHAPFSTGEMRFCCCCVFPDTETEQKNRKQMEKYGVMCHAISDCPASGLRRRHHHSAHTIYSFCITSSRGVIKIIITIILQYLDKMLLHIS